MSRKHPSLMQGFLGCFCMPRTGFDSRCDPRGFLRLWREVSCSFLVWGTSEIRRYTFYFGFITVTFGFEHRFNFGNFSTPVFRIKFWAMQGRIGHGISLRWTGPRDVGPWHDSARMNGTRFGLAWPSRAYFFLLFSQNTNLLVFLAKKWLPGCNPYFRALFLFCVPVAYFLSCCVSAAYLCWMHTSSLSER